ncbi:sialate O-acetylesterase [Salmonella enterica]|nr:sialate O-acetylesterase [Salmonella enterica]EDX5409193.1 sialate O-acetylesterase [Salmonella enterica subsp. enterica serovar Ealing]EAW3044283.1 sialate O-acetylesterase [Salmonella enterica]ECS7527364.1 sialate O-acetylesterase [Salmonella enterica]EGK7841906.1 sialate O-acetylesterase [Salmonella enterica]
MSIVKDGQLNEFLLFPGQTVDLSEDNEFTQSLLSEGYLHIVSGGGDTPTQPPDVDDDNPPVTPDTPTDNCSSPDYWYVVPVAGQSNGMAYGEGIPLPETLDKPHPRIKQLARRATMTPDGDTCAFNDVIPLDHCPHDVQDMSKMNHPKADLTKGQYGTVSQALHIAKKLLAYIPDNAGILIVPCCRGGSAFTQGADGAYNATTGATEASARWGVGKPLYQDLIARTKAALDKNPKNQLLAVVWMQGEFDMSAATYAQQPALFAAMVKQFRTDLSDHAGQCPDFNAVNVPWICGDTTYYWKNTYPTQYDAVYGAYKTCSEPGVHFVPFMTDENGVNTPTNTPAEDPDVPAAHYFGAASRTAGNMVSSLRASHFSSWARRNIIPERLATAILLNAGRKSLLAAPSGSSLSTSEPVQPSATGSTRNYAPAIEEFGYNGRRGDGTLQQQGWTTVTGGTFTPKDAEDNKGGHFLNVVKAAQQVWKIEQPVSGAVDLLKYGGKLSCKFRLKGTITANQFAFGFYLGVRRPELPAGVTIGGPADFANVAAFFVQTGATNILLMQHGKDNTRLGDFGAFDNGWHTLEFIYQGGNSVRITPVIDGTKGTPFDLQNTPADTPKDTLSINGITSAQTYEMDIENFSIQIYRDDGSIMLSNDDVSSYVYFPVGYNGGKVVIPDAPITAGKTVKIVANNAGTISIEPASNNVLINGVPSASATDSGMTLVQQSGDGRTWVTT